jgi:hypothetical protein
VGGPWALKFYQSAGFCKIYYSHFIFEVITFLRKIKISLKTPQIMVVFQKIEGKTTILKVLIKKIEGKTIPIL